MHTAGIPTHWIAADGFRRLRAAELQLWCTSPAAHRSRLGQYRSLLSGPEIRRAQRIASPQNRDTFIAARALLRMLLGCVFDCDPRAVLLTQTLRGKPIVQQHPQVHFNVSHSCDSLMLVVTQAGPVGVDVQQVRPAKPVRELAGRFFAPAEQQVFDSLPPGRHTELFYRMWSLKEACVKATGVGLARLHMAELMLPADGPPRFTRYPGAFAASVQPPQSGYSAAVVALAAPSGISCYRLE